ncbi:fimbrial protein [Serratia odorifera]|uniref:Type-1A pilin n=1 Tax=Serratia odorifera TaxID=618 RepID=A0A3S5D7F7_SEROD|nr:fimbrial protein [Serratia odorifera]VDZ58365.1 Type-1A pilin [Serratia odorifera]
MRYSTIISAALMLSSAVALAGNRHHVIIDGGQVKLRGAITAAACSVSTGSEAQIVEMGDVRSNQFSGLGSYSPPVAFSIDLTGCNRAIYHAVGVSFWGVTDGKDPLVLKAGNGAQGGPGIGLALFDDHGDLMVPNAPPSRLAMINDRETRLHFSARYRATSRQVTGGEANSWAWFALTYQ